MGPPEGKLVPSLNLFFFVECPVLARQCREKKCGREVALFLIVVGSFVDFIQERTESVDSLSSHHE